MIQDDLFKVLFSISYFVIARSQKTIPRLLEQ